MYEKLLARNSQKYIHTYSIKESQIHEQKTTVQQTSIS